MSRVVKLEELCLPDQIGKYGIPAVAEEFSEDKVRYLRITDIDDYGNLLENDKKSVSSPEIEKYILKEGDIVFARTGNSTGRTYYHEEKNGELAFAGFLIKFSLDESKVNPKYLKYFTISKPYKQWVDNLSNGSTRGNINAKTFADCPIILPSREQQDYLVRVLSSLEDKIQINNQINQELEAMAKTLYNYWFVQFDFPDQNGKPYKSSGGKMVYNPELKREIPEGWGVEKLSEFLVLNKDKYNKELNWQKIHYLETSNLIENKIEKLKKLDIKSDKIPSRAKEIVKDRDILYSLVRPNQMHFGFIRNPIQNLVASTGFVLLSCEENPEYNIFFYLFMTLPINVRKMIKLSESSTSSYPSIRPEDILNMEIVTPYDFSNYRGLVENLDKIYNQIDVLYKQNETLTQLRDCLLPMLMNGQVKVE